MKTMARSWTVAVACVLALGACADSDKGGTTEPSGRHGKDIAFFGFAKANSFAQATWAAVLSSPATIMLRTAPIASCSVWSTRVSR